MQEYIHKSSNEIENELIELIKKYNDKTGEYLFVFASSTTKQVPDNILNMDDYHSIYFVLKDITKENLSVYIETLGGSGEASEEIARFLHSKFENVNFIVSGEAKSAGTILVLSGNEIYMTNSGSLGPIDAQIQIQAGRSYISAFDYMEWVDNTRDLAGKTGTLNPFDALMVAQINPGELKLVHHNLEFAKDRVKEWLPKYKFKNWTKTEHGGKVVDDDYKKKRAKQIADALTNHGKWRSHGRSLKIDDLEGIGLKINKIDDDSVLADIIYRIQVICRILFTTTNSYKIYATKDEKLFRNVITANAPSVDLPGNKEEMKVAEFELTCGKCQEKHKLYAKFVDDPKIDEDFKNKGVQPYPKNNKLMCSCGFEIDLSGMRNDLEHQVGKKFVL
jgi:hypothetical protein